MTLPRSTAWAGRRRKAASSLGRASPVTRGAWTGRLRAWGRALSPLLSAWPVLWAETWGNVMPGDLPKLEEARW